MTIMFAICSSSLKPCSAELLSLVYGINKRVINIVNVLMTTYSPPYCYLLQPTPSLHLHSPSASQSLLLDVKCISLCMVYREMQRAWLQIKKHNGF